MTTIRIRDVSLFVKVTGKGYPLVLMVPVILPPEIKAK
jgi:hypothetical protein